MYRVSKGIRMLIVFRHMTVCTECGRLGFWAFAKRPEHGRLALGVTDRSWVECLAALAGTSLEIALKVRAATPGSRRSTLSRCYSV